MKIFYTLKWEKNQEDEAIGWFESMRRNGNAIFPIFASYPEGGPF
jgi:hypothetical protein